jgi:hypothetical protein
VDVVLRARHDQIEQEFLCASTELRLLHTPPGSRWTRTIEAFCGDERAERFGTRLTDFSSCCATCRYLSLDDVVDAGATPAADVARELLSPA